MSHGSRRRNGAPRIYALVRRADIAALVGFLVVIPLAAAASKLIEQHGARRLWHPPGAPCPTAGALLRNSPQHPPRTFAFQELTVTRLGGNVDCSVVEGGSPFDASEHTVCRFDRPVMLKVSAAGVTRIFMVGVGRPATVLLEDGRPACRLTG